MKNKSTIITLIIIIAFSVSCKDKEAEKLKQQQLREKHKKEDVLRLNKDFMYYCAIISSKTKIPLVNVKSVLKEYFIFKKDFVFKANSFIVLNDNNKKHSKKHNLDLIKETSEKYAITFENVVKIYCELEFFEKLDDLEDQIFYLDCTIQDLESEIDKTD